MLILNHFMHQNQILNRLKQSSDTTHMQKMVLEDLPTPSKPAPHQIV